MIRRFAPATSKGARGGTSACPRKSECLRGRRSDRLRNRGSASIHSIILLRGKMNTINAQPGVLAFESRRHSWELLSFPRSAWGTQVRVAERRNEQEWFTPFERIRRKALPESVTFGGKSHIIECREVALPTPPCVLSHLLSPCPWRLSSCRLACHGSFLA